MENVKKPEINQVPNENERRFPGNKIHSTVVFGPNVIMGVGNEIGPYCIIGFPGEHRERWGEDKGVEIGNGNILTGLLTIDSGIDGPTEISNNVMIMKHAHIGHDAIIGSHVTISCGAKIGGHSKIGYMTNIGLNAVIHQKHEIYNHCMVAMGAVITLKCVTRPGYMYAGNPAAEKGRNKKAPAYLFTIEDINTASANANNIFNHLYRVFFEDLLKSEDKNMMEDDKL